MSTDDRVMAVLERANPVPNERAVDVPTSAQRYLEDLQQRSNIVTASTTTEEQHGNRRTWMMLGIAASVVALIVVAAFLIGGDNDAINIDAPETIPTTVPTTATIAATPEPGPIETAQIEFDRFVQFYNGGGLDDVAASLADDFLVTNQFDTGAPDPNNEPEDDPESGISWQVAQGMQWTDRTCQPADEQPSVGVLLRCQWGTSNAIIGAVDGAPVATEALVLVTDDKLAELHLGYGLPGFSNLEIAFSGWMSRYRLDAPAWEPGDWTNREEAIENGQARARFAKEWSLFLEEWGCSPVGGCSISLERWIVEYDLRCNTADVPGPDSSSLVTNRLSSADRQLNEPGQTAEQIAELQQQRLDAMIELGIDERCHPDVG